MKELKFGTCLPVFAQCADRYVQSGYGPRYTMQQVFERITKVPDITGVELVGNWHINDDNFVEVTDMLKDCGLGVCMVVPDLWTQGKWGSGTFTSKDEKIRREAIAEVKKCMDWAASVNCDKVDVWFGQDGFDYPFQMDYQEAWQQLIDGLRECCDYRKDVDLVIEYKLKEPRTNLFVSTAGKTRFLINEVGRDNLGILDDLGHSQAAGENVADGIATCGDLLWAIHVNDNYCQWDDDMMYGSLHTIWSIEAMYWLDRVGYDYYYTLDMNPYREDGIKMAQESIDWIKGYYGLIDRIGKPRIEQVIKSGDATEMSRMMREALLGAK